MEKKQFTIYGRVQSVGFRFYVAQQAKKWMLNGSVKNLSDGSVLVIAIGELEAINNLHQWLKIGPATAKVEHVIEQDYVGGREFNGFKIER